MRPWHKEPCVWWGPDYSQEQAVLSECYQDFVTDCLSGCNVAYYQITLETCVFVELHYTHLTASFA